MSNEKVQNNFEWSKYDFEVNRYFWMHQGEGKSFHVRVKNLADLFDVFMEHGVQIWLQGKTLLGIYKYGELLEDHDDDVGVWQQDRAIIENKVYPKLNEKGFAIIRNSENIVSFIRGDRYIDICFFRVKGRKAGYSEKWFQKYHFEMLDDVSFDGKQFFVPKDTGVLLKNMYEPSILARLGGIARKASRFFKYSAFYERILTGMAKRVPHFLRIFSNLFFRTAGIRYKKYSEAEFLKTLIEPEDSFNWKWRKPHLDVITNGGQFRRIGEIVQYLKSTEGLCKLIEQVKETDTSTPFLDPANYDKRFWQSGNNFFIYCIKYEYKKGVISYSNVNEYIRKNCRPALFTAEYYETLQSMSVPEIEELLKRNPIEITGGAIVSGKHRACAMIGRMVSGKPYIPFWALCR